MRKKRSNFLILLIIVPIVIGGCALKKKDTTKNTDWENEILMAQSCGMDGLMCCPDKDPQCQFGQECCVDPNDPKRNYCSDECNFGTEGAFCRAGEDKCDNSLVCLKGNCTACGGDNEPCCSGDSKCNEELLCHKEVCVECGLPGNPCCGEERSCLDNDSNNSRIECRNSICTFCGSLGGIACEDSPECDDWHLFNNGSCLSCGGYNQPCCSDGKEKTCKEPGLQCRVGFCAKAQ